MPRNDKSSVGNGQTNMHLMIRINSSSQSGYILDCALSMYTWELMYSYIQKVSKAINCSKTMLNSWIWCSILQLKKWVKQLSNKKSVQKVCQNILLAFFNVLMYDFSLDTVGYFFMGRYRMNYYNLNKNYLNLMIIVFFYKFIKRIKTNNNMTS